MSLLSAVELLKLVEDGIIEGVSRESINAASIDVHLGDTFLIEQYNEVHPILDLSKREAPVMKTVMDGIILEPGQFCLTHTVETFYLPDYISGQFILKSSMARAGLEHSQAGWADSGWSGSSLTLELTNLLKHNRLMLKKGMAIGQMVFFKHAKVPPEFLYTTKGRYNNDKSVHGMKP